MYLAWEALSKFVPDLYIGACIRARALLCFLERF